ncbi:MAG: chorismate-binding protein [Bacteroidota bacterium]|jgi:para-aminobenzoate synthetase component 1
MLTRYSNWIIFPEKGKDDFQYFAGDIILEASSEKKNCFGYLKYPEKWNDKCEPVFFYIEESGTISKKHFEEKKTESKIGDFVFPDKNIYLENITKIKNHIQLGDIYEMNYCIAITANVDSLNPFDIFLRIHKNAEAPHACLAKFGDDYIICTSPERFLKREANKIITQPIKGTAKRGKSREEDELLKNNLSNSIKEKSEHVMAVDVARNDLSRIAQKNSVEVKKLYGIHTFKQVHQMISTVSCNLKPDVVFEEIIDATFPMASMTGAPKIRATQLINEFENFKRGFYSGSIGVIKENGDFDFNVVIRSIIYNEATKRIMIGVGGAITNLSEPEEEWEECILKANILVSVLQKKASED